MKTKQFDGTVSGFDPATKIVTMEGGAKIKLGDASRQTPKAGQRVRYSVKNKDAKKIGGDAAITATRFMVQDEKSAQATTAPVGGGSTVNTTDRR